jgi:DNA primase
LAYDADSAGQKATSRVYEWERKHEVDVVVATFPGGSDPGELARTDPEALARAVAEARPFLQFRIDRILEAGDLSSAEGRARAAEAALAAVAEHPVDLVRDQYVMQLSDRCRLDASRLREKLEYVRAHPPDDTGTKPGRHRHDPPPRQHDPGEIRDPEDSDWEE